MLDHATGRCAALGAALLLAVSACDGGGGPTASLQACRRSGGTDGGAIALSPGAAQRLPDAQVVCISLPTGDYVAAYADTRAADAARTAREPVLDSFTVAAADARSTGNEPSATFDALPPPLRFAEEWRRPPRADAATAPDPTTRAAPWTRGETFLVNDPVTRTDRTAVVQRIYDGWLVVAALENDGDALRALLALDGRWAQIRDVGMPLLRAVYGDSLPVTSRGSGQLFVLMRPLPYGPTGITYGVTDGDGVYSWIVLSPAPATPPVQVGSMAFHETTHAFQRRYLRATLPPGSPVTVTPGGARWGVEGGAALMERELARRVAGISPTANYDWRAPGPTDTELWYALFAQPGDGSFSQGYYVSAGFMADLAGRLAAAGMPQDSAMAQVERGAAEGWYGWAGPAEGQRTGLAARMRARLGASWDPGDALQTWTLSHVLDDRTPSTVYQTPAFRDVWNLQGTTGWAAHATLSPGGAGWAVKRQYGSVGYFYLGGGGSYRLRATTAGVRWMVARIR